MTSFLRRRWKAFEISVFGRTDIGRASAHNEDHLLIADLTRGRTELDEHLRRHSSGRKGSLLLVADGVGGAAAGEVASAMAAGAVYEHLSAHWGHDRHTTADHFADHMKDAVEAANRQIHEYAVDHPELVGMATTTTAVGVLGADLCIAQVGDSRAYRVRQGVATQLTDDQSLVRHLEKAGQLTEAREAANSRRNVILQALGPSAEVSVDQSRETVERGDVLVLCSDGLSGLVSAEEIAGTVTAITDPAAACDDLVELANSRGGPDNITVIVARFGEAGPSRSARRKP